MKPVWIEVKGYSFLETFTTNEGIFYGEKLPDLAFVQLAIRDVPALSFCAEPNAIRMGLDVAFAGFPFGSDGLLLRIDDQPPIVVQATPFLRHGVISSVHPFPCPQPHGFRSTQFPTVEQAVLRFFDATTRQCWECCTRRLRDKASRTRCRGICSYWAGWHAQQRDREALVGCTRCFHS